MQSKQIPADVTLITLALLKSSGGPTKTIRSFKEALGARHYCFCSRDELANDSLAIPDAQAVYASGLPGLKQFRYVNAAAGRAATEAVQSSRIVSCHSFYRYHIEWMNRMHREYGVPYWFVPHGVLDPWVYERASLVKRLFWRSIGQRFIDNASTIIFSTSAERDKAASRLDLPSAEVVPWPVDPVDCSRRTLARERIRRKLSIPEEAKVLLYFGRLHSMKRPLETIRAVVAADKDVQLIVVGNEQDVSLGECRRVAEKCGARDRVHLVGPVYDQAKFDYMFASDAYISLSNRENFNHTAAESLSAGLPLILSPGNDLAGEISAEACSWHLPDMSEKALVFCIEAFVNKSADDLRMMGQRGQAWVASNLGFETFSRRLNQLKLKYGR